METEIDRLRMGFEQQRASVLRNITLRQLGQAVLHETEKAETPESQIQ